jgi:signal transduction histidine kinase
MMDQLLRSRSERVIAVGRLVMSFFVLGAVWLDPSQPAQEPQLTYTLLALYMAVSVLLFQAQRPTPLSPTYLGLPASTLDLAVHVLELSLFAFLLYATDGLTSPYFPLFTFSILGATFRWGWKGALWTSVAVLVLLIVSTVLQIKFDTPAQLETDRFFIRCAHVLVIGAMLTYFAFHQQRAEGEILRLGRWVPGPSDTTQISEYLSRCTQFAAEVFATSRAVIIGQGPDEPWASCISYENGSIRQERLPSEDGSFVPDSSEQILLGGCVNPEMLMLTPGGYPLNTHPPESFRRLCSSVGASHVLSAPFQTDLFVGRLLILDRPDFSLDEMMVASLAARQIESGLGRIGEIDALRRAAAFEERLTMARDLHDGVLQTLSATSMHLEVIRQSPSESRLGMAALQEWLLKEQRELRRLIERLRNDDLSEPVEPPYDEGLGLNEIAAAVEQRWGIPVELTRYPSDLRLGERLTFQFLQIMREAAANAVRHGGASRLSVALAAKDDQLEIRITDDGKGLAQYGTFDAQQCFNLGLGPRNLRERAGALGGSFQVSSRPDGLDIEIILPLEQLC